MGINNRGQIVGDYGDAGGTVHGSLLDKGALTTIDVPGATSTEAGGINDHGQISGWYGDVSGTEHGFLLDKGTFTTIDVPGAIRTNAYGINARGQFRGLIHRCQRHAPWLWSDTIVAAPHRLQKRR